MSNPLTCGFTEDTLLQFFVSQANAEPHTDGNPFSIDALTSYVEWQASSVTSCGTSEDLEYLAHINTPNLARDLDLIRQLSGYQELDFFGFEEGGSILAVTYAAMFPDRVGKIVAAGMSK